MAGLISHEQEAVIITTIQRIFGGVNNAEICSDSMGAARALWNEDEGAVGILGTGSAGFWYDGTSISSRIPSLGYQLGNEGSGFHLGKNLVKML